MSIFSAMFTEGAFDIYENYLSVEGLYMVRHITNVTKQSNRALFFQ